MPSDIGPMQGKVGRHPVAGLAGFARPWFDSVTMTTQRPMSPWVGLILLVIGGYMLLISTGVLPYASMTRKKGLLDGPQHWQVICVGLSLLCCGISVGLQQRKHWLLTLNGYIAGVAMALPLGWLLFFSGQVDPGFTVLGGLILGVTTLGMLLGWRQARQGRGIPTGQGADPLAEAQVYLAYGRVAQARAVLMQAQARYPARAAEFQRVLDTL